MDTELLLTSTPSERLQQETSVLRVLICSLFYTSLFIFYRLTGPYSYSLVHLSTHTPHPKLTSSRRWNWTLFFLPHANVRKKSKGWLTLCLSVGCRSIWLYCAGDYKEWAELFIWLIFKTLQFILKDLFVCFFISWIFIMIIKKSISHRITGWIRQNTLLIK